MKIYTKRGDSGETDLFGGERVLKNHTRVKAFGDIDCANTAVGLAYSADNVSEDIKNALTTIMRLLFCAGAEVATAPKSHAKDLLEKWLKNRINDHHVLMLEAKIDEIEQELPPLKSFILPCGTDLAARLHFARNMVRKAEISLLDLQIENQALRPEILRFFNRLSDYLFVLARLANKRQALADIEWSGQLEDA